MGEEELDIIPLHPPSDVMKRYFELMEEYRKTAATVPRIRCITGLMHGRSDERWDRADD